MKPELARLIRLARIRLGSSLTEEERAELQQEEDLDHFKVEIARLIGIEVRFALFSEIAWNRNTEGCSLQFSVDGNLFVLRHTALGWELNQHIQGEHVPLTILADDGNFQDHLLIAIDDALSV